MTEGRSIELDLEPLPDALADPALVKQIWQCLLSNAIKFTRSAAAPRIRVWSSTEDGVTIWSIADNGSGFDPAKTDALFGAFVRPRQKPQGVGLSIAWRAVTQMNGWLWCESTPGQGATFHFTLGSQE
jgi:signal transduction histidine kinase